MESAKPNSAQSAATAVPSFEEVLLQLAAAVAEGVEPLVLVNDFCRLARLTFELDGVYCWRREAYGISGMAADGLQAEKFLTLQFADASQSAVLQAVASRATVQYDDVPKECAYNSFKILPAISFLAIPIIVAGDVIGAVVFVHNSKTHYFTEQIRTRASILTAQLGNLIETARLARAAREQRQRADAMIESAAALYTRLDTDSARDGLTHRLLSALNAELVALLHKESGPNFTVKAIAFQGERAPLLGDATALARFASVALGNPDRDYPLILDLKHDGLELPMATSGQVLVLPMNVHEGTCEVIIYGGAKREFREQDIALARAICGVGALAIQNSQLFATSRNQALELKQLLEISSELGVVTDLDQFLKRFVLRAAEFLGFRRSFIAMVENDGVCRTRYVSSSGSIVPLVVDLPKSYLPRILSNRAVFFTNDATKEPEVDQEFLTEFHVTQILTVPLYGSDGNPLGVIGVLDRLDGGKVIADDGERALALAAQVATVLESTRNLHLAEVHRRRAENLMSLALEISSSIRLPELVTSMTRRAMDMLGGRAAALALSRGGEMETVFVQSPRPEAEKAILRRLNTALTELVAHRNEPIVEGRAGDLLTQALANALGWNDLTIARLSGADGELIGVLCIANREAKLEAIDRNVLQALAGHASVALDNSRLFMRIAQANSQWVEIFDAISDFIIVHDHNNKVLRVNRSMADFIDIRPAELIGVGMRALMAMAQDIGPDPCPFCRTGAEEQDEFLHPVLERIYLVSTSRIHGSLEEGMQTIHVLKDITDRREAERRYRELFDNIQEGLFFSTPEGHFIEVNDALVRMLGYESRDELLKIDIKKDLYVEEGDRSKFEQELARTGILRNYEEILRRKDGSWIYTLQNVLAVRDAQGNIVQYRGLMLDISDVKEFQSELQHQRDFNDKILNNTQSVILVSDTAGLIAYANQRCYEVGGYSAGELVGRKLSELVAEPKRQAFETALAQTLIGQQIDNLELPITMAQGHVGQYSVNLSPMRDELEQVSSIVVVMSDISDVALLQAKLTQTEKMAAVGQLVSGVAHEVNNPLTAILGFADLLASQDDVPAQAKNDLNIIIQEAQRTKQIVQNLLSFARQSPPQHEPLQVNEVLRRTLQLRAYDFSSHGIEVHEHYDEALPELIGDTHQLQQVFLNVLNNAYDAVRETGRQGHIDVTTSFREGMVEIQFADNGAGIKFPERIFDPFYTTKGVGKGTGLGLSICYGIMREHGGDIAASNRPDGQGAMFNLRLPSGASSEAAAGGAR